MKTLFFMMEECIYFLLLNFFINREKNIKYNFSNFNLSRLFYRFAPKTSTKKEKSGMKGITISMVATIIILFMVFIILVIIFTKMYNAIPSPL